MNPLVKVIQTARSTWSWVLTEQGDTVEIGEQFETREACADYVIERFAANENVQIMVDGITHGPDEQRIPLPTVDGKAEAAAAGVPQ